MRQLPARRLTASAFAPFGEVIEASSSAEQIAINYGYTTRFNDLARIDVDAGGGRPIVSIFRARALESPLLKVFERHPLGSQAFIPLTAKPYLIAAAPSGDFDPRRIEVFWAGDGQGVNYARGVWHHFLLAMDGQSDFLVIDRAGPGDNLDEIFLDERDQILVEPLFEGGRRGG